MKIVNFGGRMIPVGHLRVGERVIAYNPYLHAVAREGNHGEILPQSEMPVSVTNYYLGCFQRGSLFALEPEKEETEQKSSAADLNQEENSEKVESKIHRKKKQDADECKGNAS